MMDYKHRAGLERYNAGRRCGMKAIMIAPLILLLISVAPATRPDPGPAPAIEPCGPVRMAHYIRPFVDRDARQPYGQMSAQEARYYFASPPYGCWPCEYGACYSWFGCSYRCSAFFYCN